MSSPQQAAIEAQLARTSEAPFSTFAFYDEYRNRRDYIRNAFKFAERIHDLGNSRLSHASGAVWLRGHANGKWKLQPKIGRSEPLWLGLSLQPKLKTGNPSREEVELRENIEYNLLGRFRRHAHTYLRREPNKWETITLAQHHGLATRLLDWTSNPLVALYFAAEAEAQNDGAIFAIRLTKYFTHYLSVHQDEPRFQGHEPEPLKVAGIKIVFPMMSSDRLVAQSGAFTIQNPWTPLERQAHGKFEEGSLDIVKMFKWRLPKERKVDIVRQLNRVGVHHKALFPSLEGAGVGLLRDQLLRTDILTRHSGAPQTVK
jgi:hypothetical protein